MPKARKRRGRPLQPLEVRDEEREQLERYVRRGTTAQRLALRARIVLECAKGVSNKLVARRLGVSVVAVGKWRARFIKDRLEGLTDEPRPGAPRTIGDDKVEEIVRLTLETKPEDATHWSTRKMGATLGVSAWELDLFGRVGTAQAAADAAGALQLAANGEPVPFSPWPGPLPHEEEIPSVLAIAGRRYAVADLPPDAQELFAAIRLADALLAQKAETCQLLRWGLDALTRAMRSSLLSKW